MTSVHRFFGASEWLCVANSPEIEDIEKTRRQRETRELAGRSKTYLWGPTHSVDSDDNTEMDGANARMGHTRQDSNAWQSSSSNPTIVTPSSTRTKSGTNPLPTSNGTDSTKSSSHASPTQRATPIHFPEHENPIHPLERMWEKAQCALAIGQCTSGHSALEQPKQRSVKSNQFFEYVGDTCSSCHPKSLEEALSGRCTSGSIAVSPTNERSVDMPSSPLGISPLEAPGEEKKEDSLSARRLNPARLQRSASINSNNSTNTNDTPASRRRQRHRERQLRSPPPPILTNLREEVEVTPNEVVYNGPKPSKGAKLPLDTLTVHQEEARALERSISELTMRSSYAGATAKLAENRRMAYYAVGRHHRNSGRGGNRRCYFTGKLILGGAPFYAGSVQQGLRTLVVFCLPSAVGLPKGMEFRREGSLYSALDDRRSTGTGRDDPNRDTVVNQLGVNAQPRHEQSLPSLLARKRSAVSRLSSLDDMSLSIEEDLDPNWELDRDYLLGILPEPGQGLLDEMALRYPEQFETLPVQVRSPHCWRLYVKFCFFSGLPIAEGELHYKVRDQIANETYGEEIILSHEVMEAVNGDSAEILRLPNLKTFRYLRKHYSQQSGKLSDEVFQRQSWEMVRPEV